MAYAYRDQNGNAWSIEDTGANFTARITQAAYGMPGGSMLAVGEDKGEVEGYIWDVVDEYNQTGKVVMRGGTLIAKATAAVKEAIRPKVGLIPILVVVALVLATGKKGRR